MAWQNPNTAANATEERRQKDASNFQKMVQMLGMARQTDGQTMLGFALGKLLRGAYDHYKDARDDTKQREFEAKMKRLGYINADGSIMTPEQQRATDLKRQNAMNFFGMNNLYDAATAGAYGVGKTWKQRMRDDFMRMALDPDYKARMEAKYGPLGGSQNTNTETSTAQATPSALQNFIDNRYPDYKQQAREAVLPTPQLQMPTSTSVTQSERSVTDANGKTVSDKQTTVSHPNWDAMESKSSLATYADLLGAARDPINGWKRDEYRLY